MSAGLLGFFFPKLCWGQMGAGGQLKAEAATTISILIPVSCTAHGKVCVFWLFKLRKFRQRSTKHLPFTAQHPQRTAPRQPFVRLWLHLQPEQGADALGFSASSGGVEHRLAAINTNKVFSSSCTVYSMQTRLTLEVIYSDYVYNNSCSEYTRTSLAKIGLESLF